MNDYAVGDVVTYWGDGGYKVSAVYVEGSISDPDYVRLTAVDSAGQLYGYTFPACTQYVRKV